MRIVVALGGNALLKRGETPTAGVQQRNIGVAADAVASLAGRHAVIVTHGNGPQVGLLALQAAAYGDPTFPLDALGAESEGLIGYWLEQALLARLPDAKIATLLTQVEVAPDDPAFAAPEKPIGPAYDAATAARIARERGWSMAVDGERVRRVVASPEPRRILEIATIRLLVDAGVIVVCAGGGGIPVIIDAAGAIRGAEAVVDKDLSAALLAAELRADVLLMLTDVPAVYRDWPNQENGTIRCAGPDDISPADFAPGSMRPKIEAARRFCRKTGGKAVIGALTDAAALLAGERGTTIAATAKGLTLY